MFGGGVLIRGLVQRNGGRRFMKSISTHEFYNLSKRWAEVKNSLYESFNVVFLFWFCVPFMEGLYKRYKALKSNIDLNDHKRIHKCDICDKAFKKRTNLTR